MGLLNTKFITVEIAADSQHIADLVDWTGRGQCLRKDEVLQQFKNYKYVNGKEEIAAPLLHPALESPASFGNQC